MSEPGSADLQKQLGEMRAEFLKGLTSLKDDQVAGLREVAGELGKVQLRLVAVEASMSEQAEIKTELKELRDKVSELELWKAGFTGEKGERDKNSDNNAAFWRRIAGGLLGALILAHIVRGLAVPVGSGAVGVVAFIVVPYLAEVLLEIFPGFLVLVLLVPPS